MFGTIVIEEKPKPFASKEIALMINCEKQFGCVDTRGLFQYENHISR